jgi:hypothetical protein
VLGICKHGLPTAGDFVGKVLVHECYGATSCPPLSLDNGVHWDPLDRWFHYVSEFRRALHIARILHEGLALDARRQKSLLEGDWGREHAASLVRTLTQDPGLLKAELTIAVNQWLLLGKARPFFQWQHESSEPTFVLSGGTFGLLATQLMLSVAQAHSLALCSACCGVYIRGGRKQQRGRRNYCPQCRGRIASRHRQREWRATRVPDKRRETSRKAKERM